MGAKWELGGDANLHPGDVQVLPDPVQLTDRRAVDQFIEVVTLLAPRLIVIDTASRCMTGADENSAKDMSLVIESADRMRKATEDTTVLLLHHTGKDGTTVRGSSALESGADVVYQTSGDERAIALKRTKRKDGLKDRRNRLRVEEVGDSVVVVSLDPLAQPSGNLTDTERSVWDRLGDVFKDQPVSAAQLADATGKARAGVYGALSRLVQRGLVHTVPGGRGAQYKRMPGADPDA